MTDLERLHEQSFGWALSCCGWDHHMAEDVLQTTYVKVLSGAAKYGGRSAFRTWLFSVIRRTALEHARRARSRAEGMRRWGREARHPAAAEPDDQVVRDELTARLRAALWELPGRQREVMHLVFYQGLTIAEASAVMGVSLGTARTHYERGKRGLRSMLREEATR